MKYLQLHICTVCFFVATLFLNGCNDQENPPNILFITSDDMSFGHTSFDGYPEVKTPNIDFLAKNGLYFENAYCSAPSCAPSRSSILTGKNGYELEEGSVLWSFLPKKFKTYPDILEENGYFVGFTGKGCAPQDLEIAGRTRNPAGNEYNEIKKLPFTELGNDGAIWDVDYAANFEVFLSKKPQDKPFCFWYGALEPHRRYSRGIGQRAEKDISKVDVPDFLIDNKVTRSDILDYLFEIEWFDEHIGRILEQLKAEGQLSNTLIIVTSDNGMPFPRAKANLYEYGTHMPFIVYWADKIKEGRQVNDFISFADIAPTILDASNVHIPNEMTGKSFLDIIAPTDNQQNSPARDFIVTYKERHASWVQPNGNIAPMRAIRKGDYLLIWNLEPNMWPAGHINPKYNWNQYPFGDVDNGPTKDEMMKLMNNEKDTLFKMAFGKRPEYELYNVAKDPFNLNNLAPNDKYKIRLERMKKKLVDYLTSTNDPRMLGNGKEDVFYNAPYFAMQGFETGGLFLKKWQALDSLGKAKAIENVEKNLDEQLDKLKKMGWDIDEVFNETE